ncbi:MAG TPA: ABC transporter ATP-binding protein [Streptosporangiaceae bacterium]|nr:ABC transporter ATP-binding protein [Streptosporangiaceae bacterium]
MTALNQVTLTVSKGEILGLLGPNGAGKTTLIKIITTVLLPTSGSVSVLGFDVVTQARSIKGRLGIVFGGERGFYGRLSVRENLDYWSAVYRIPRRNRAARSAELLEQLGIADQSHLPFERLSKGMKQRVHLARGLIGDPDLILLDEPTSGLDPAAALQLRSVFGELRRDGRTILLATHDMAEAETLCDRIAFIDHGEIIAVGSPRELGPLFASYDRVDARLPDEALRALVAGVPGVGQLTELGEGWLRIHTTSQDAATDVLRALVAAGVTALRTSQPTLEEIYLAVIGDRGLKL